MDNCSPENPNQWVHPEVPTRTLALPFWQTLSSSGHVQDSESGAVGRGMSDADMQASIRNEIYNDASLVDDSEYYGFAPESIPDEAVCPLSLVHITRTTVSVYAPRRFGLDTGAPCSAFRVPRVYGCVRVGQGVWVRPVRTHCSHAAARLSAACQPPLFQEGVDRFGQGLPRGGTEGVGYAPITGARGESSREH